MKQARENTKRVRQPRRNREKILKRALKLFSVKGFHALSIQAIADDCGLSQSAVFNHFKSKKVLLAAIAEHLVHEVNEHFDEDVRDNAEERLVKFFRQNMEWLSKQPGQARVISILSNEATFDKEFAEIYSQRLQYARKYIVAILYAGVREGLFRCEDHIEETAAILHSALSHGLTSLLACQEKPDVEAEMKKWRLLIDKMTK